MLRALPALYLIEKFDKLLDQTHFSVPVICNHVSILHFEGVASDLNDSLGMGYLEIPTSLNSCSLDA